MSRLFLTLMFSLSTLTGLGLIVYGARLKPARNRDTAASEDDIVLEFSDAGEGNPEILELEKGPDDMDFDEKKHFDPGKHRPEKIESKKSGEGPDPAA
jgi:hypothetical protein